MTTDKIETIYGCKEIRKHYKKLYDPVQEKKIDNVALQVGYLVTLPDDQKLVVPSINVCDKAGKPTAVKSIEEADIVIVNNNVTKLTQQNACFEAGCREFTIYTTDPDPEA